jgi:hypothetical protein
LQPAAWAPFQVGFDGLASGRAGGVDGRNIECHGVKQLQVQLSPGALPEFDFLGNGGDAAEDELVVYGQKGIRRTVPAVGRSCL